MLGFTVLGVTALVWSAHLDFTVPPVRNSPFLALLVSSLMDTHACSLGYEVLLKGNTAGFSQKEIVKGVQRFTWGEGGDVQFGVVCAPTP